MRKFICEKSELCGEVFIPASKSHTIRAVNLATLARGISLIHRPLISGDTLAALAAATALGAKIETGEPVVVEGVDGSPLVPKNVIDVKNSGTTLYLFMGTAALAEGYSVLTGDDQIVTRPVEPLLGALQMLGVQGFATRGNGRPPVVIKGPAQGGLARLEGKVSQFVSSLLINCAFMHRDSHIEVIHVTEKPFIRMTLDWLDRLGIHYRAADDFSAFDVAGGQRITGFETTIPGDFSSATFFLVAASLRSSEITLRGLDMKDTQGDKQVIQFLRQMGADIQAGPDAITVRGGSLKGLELDLGDTPDALPAMAVAGCFAEGRTLIRNVANARLKETDRIAVMAAELTQLGARIKELPDGLEIFESRLHGGPVHGHNDHRVVMALAVAGTAIPGRTEVDTAEAVVVTLPNFLNLMQKLGARIHEEET